MFYLDICQTIGRKLQLIKENYMKNHITGKHAGTGGACILTVIEEILECNDGRNNSTLSCSLKNYNLCNFTFHYGIINLY